MRGRRIEEMKKVLLIMKLRDHDVDMNLLSHKYVYYTLFNETAAYQTVETALLRVYFQQCTEV